MLPISPVEGVTVDICGSDIVQQLLEADITPFLAESSILVKIMFQDVCICT